MQIDRRKESEKRNFYANKLILGPMVRVGTLPMRLLALRFGADLAYTEEIIDFKLIKSRRFVNRELDTIDFVDEAGVVVFRTCAEEKNKVVLQIGTNDAERAILAAKMVETDVAAIDINMGCPKSFSLKGGMGAALLSHPDKIRDILTSLKSNLSIPVSCKIRVLPDLAETIELARLIERTGVDAIAVHGRTKVERPQHPNRDNFIRTICESIQIPVIANGGSGDIERHHDIERFRARTAASSVMISRAAMKNCSLFASRRGPSEDITIPAQNDIETLVRLYLKLSVQFDNNAINSKYCIQQMLGNFQETKQGRQLLGSYDLEAMCKIYDLHDFFVQTLEQRRSLRHRDAASKVTDNEANDTKRIDPDIMGDLIELPIVFDKNLFSSEKLPKNVLNRWLTRNNLRQPTIRTYMVSNSMFHSVLNFNDKEYSTPYLEKTKRYAEQSATLVLLLSLGLFDDTDVIDKLLVTDRNVIDALPHHENGRIYLARINK